MGSGVKYVCVSTRPSFAPGPCLVAAFSTTGEGVAGPGSLPGSVSPAEFEAVATGRARPPALEAADQTAYLHVYEHAAAGIVRPDDRIWITIIFYG